MNINTVKKWLLNNLGGNNLLLVFLMVLIVIVIVDCNTKMFSKMVEGNSDNTPDSKPVSNSGGGGGCGIGSGCGRGCTADPIDNPTNAANVNCNGGNSSNNFDSNKDVQGYDDELTLFASADKPLGAEIPKTMQEDYSVLKSFGLTKMPDVINYITGPGPQEFSTVHTATANTGTGATTGTDTDSGKEAHIRMYYAPWCGWSKKIKPEMDKFISKHHGTTVNGVKVKATIVNSEESKEETKKQGVNGFPTFKAHLIKDGGEVTNYVLDLPERTFEALEDAIKEAVAKIKSM